MTDTKQSTPTPSATARWYYGSDDRGPNAALSPRASRTRSDRDDAGERTEAETRR
ncbi:hypothetical protein [Haloterrigena turkmenica]|uniref:hypothetical protein n=1 Tax=Haloterrigena turkmenica TaxID=62320 RepID=UPI000B14D3C5|nr:hypothetical protein [Haloterrigena turkmenica]